MLVHVVPAPGRLLLKALVREIVRTSIIVIRIVREREVTDSIEQKVVALIARHKQIDPTSVALESALADLGVTSLEAITIAYDLEEDLGIEIPNEQLQSLRTVQDIVDGLDRLTAGQGT
jgi:acyl carrier protein